MLRLLYKFLILFTPCVQLVLFAEAQSACSALGQVPSAAFPICGTTVFEQIEVPVCGNKELFAPGCSSPTGPVYMDKNPFWYKFTCFKSGTLGFQIRPKDPADDYDWQLYDITGLDPDQVYTNKDIVVTGNWAGNPGNTGTSADGVPFIQCASTYEGDEPRFARMPNIIEGHQYLLLVSHYSDNQSGYDLDFSGGTAVITDPVQPALLSINNSCDAATVYLKINKQIKCSSIASDGSDFYIPNSGVHVIGASGFCPAFDTDSIELSLDQPLSPGDYEVVVREGSDGNTILDNCNNYIPENNSLPLNIPVPEPAKPDSLTGITCAPEKLGVVFDKRIVCNSVEMDGSNFSVSGPFPVQIAGVEMDCDAGGLSNTITVKFTDPIVRGGTYRITLQHGINGRLPTDECGMIIDDGVFLEFDVKDTVNADFSYSITRNCEHTGIRFSHNGAHGVSDWNWDLHDGGYSELQNPEATYPPFGDHAIHLAVSNGFCSDTASRILSLGAPLKASFEGDGVICPEDSLIVVNNSTGEIVSYLWSFGDGTTGTDPLPMHKRYATPYSEQRLLLSLTVTDTYGCSDVFSSGIRLLTSCYIAVPNAFTPNGDQINDYLYPLNAYKADDLLFRVYNRYGQKVFETTDWQKKWDGTFKGEPQSSGVYTWTLEYTHRDTGEHFSDKGSTTLIR